MILTELTLVNWRNHDRLTIKPNEKLNVIVGENGSGKTNLAEAIYYLSLGRTWRGLTNNELIKADETEAYLHATLKEGESSRKIDVHLEKNRRTISLNGKPIRRLSDLSKAANVIAFSPKDATIFTGPPAERRSFLDKAIAKEDPSYIDCLNGFEKILTERNALLKNEFLDERYLSVLTESLIKAEIPIIKRRKGYIERLEPTLKEVSKAIFGHERGVSISYNPSIDGVDEETLRLAYEESLPLDKIRGMTNKGIHKDDFSVYLDKKEVGAYGSQGENRILSLSIHLSPYFLAKENGGEPIAVLDDVYGELDEKHAKNLTDLLKTMGQTFVTTTDKTIENASVIEVASYHKEETYGRQ